MSLDLRRHDPVIIVGAGIFGLSTALHLAQRGYKNVTVFDRTAYNRTKYSYLNGAGVASADMNRIVRSAYGGVSIYQNLSLEASDAFQSWNDEIASRSSLPPGMSQQDRVSVNNGNLIMTDQAELSPFDQATVDSMNAAGHIDIQLVLTDARARELAWGKGLDFAIDPFKREARGKPNVGILDTTDGTAIADKPCRFALHKAQSLGVHFVLGLDRGSFVSIHYEGSKEKKIRHHHC